MSAFLPRSLLRSTTVCLPLYILSGGLLYECAPVPLREEKPPHPRLLEQLLSPRLLCRRDSRYEWCPIHFLAIVLRRERSAHSRGPNAGPPLLLPHLYYKSLEVFRMFEPSRGLKYGPNHPLRRPHLQKDQSR